jgi:rubredoxin
MNKFECSECGTIYRSPETTPPPGIKWSDGHVCTPKLVDNEHISKN